MDDQNEGLRERWGQPGPVPERGYAADEADVDRRTAEIRSDIEQTRADMSETVDALQDKLRPRTIVSNAAEGVRNATVGRARELAQSARDTLSRNTHDTRDTRVYGQRSGVMDRVRENPMASAIAASCIAWIAFGGARGRRRMSPAIYGSTQGSEPFIRETVISEHDDDRSKRGDYDRGTGAYASGTGDYDRSARPGEHGGVAQRAQETARDTGRRVRRAASTTQDRVLGFVRNNPLAAGAIAAAAGAAIGASLRGTRRENQLMGEAREAVVNRAQDAARGAAERVQDAAERVQNTAQRVQEAAGEAARKTTDR